MLHGGDIAEGAGASRTVKYGVTQEYVCGLEAVLPSGQIITCGGKLVKNVSGYNLIQLLIGSEGTLAVVTKIILPLMPLPKLRVDLLVPFNDFQAAAPTRSLTSLPSASSPPPSNSWSETASWPVSGTWGRSFPSTMPRLTS